MKSNTYSKKGMVTRLSEKIYMYISRFVNISETEKSIRSICVQAPKEISAKCRNYYISTIKQVVVILAISIIISIIAMAKHVCSKGEIVLDREGYGGDTKELELLTRIEDTVTRFSVDILPVEYTEEELEQIFDKGFEYIDENLLGSNSSLDSITDDLNLMSYIDELGLEVNWTSYEPDIINSSGVITKELLDKPCKVVLVAKLSYMDYSRSKEYVLNAVGRQATEKEQIINSIKSFIMEAQTKKPDEENIIIPNEVNGYTLTLSKKGINASFILICGCVAAVYVITKKNSTLKNMNKERDSILLQRYPEFVDKLLLYMGAGLSVKGALYKLSEEKHYNQSSNKSKSYNLLEEELSYTINEISSGISESDAYINLGHRLKLPVYMKISSLLSQNIKKGTKDVLIMLEQEKESSNFLKRELAKKKGEEAGTKLLFPMFVLLGIVMIIVVVPALMSF